MEQGLQAEVDALKAEVAAHPAAQGVPYVSSNDILMGLAWMLNSDASGTARPGQGVAGSQLVAMMGMDVSRHGLPVELCPPGALCNLSVVCLLLPHLLPADIASARIDRIPVGPVHWSHRV